MITRIIVLLDTILLFALLNPATAAACSISYQNGQVAPTSNCATTQPLVGAASVTAAVAAVAVGRALVSLVRGAATGPSAAMVANALAVARVAPPLQQSLAQSVQLAGQGATAANRAIGPAQQAAQAAAVAANPAAPAAAQAALAAQRAAASAAALVQSAFEGAQAAAQAATTIARAAELQAQGAARPVQQAAAAAADAARQTAAAAGQAGLQAQVAHRIAEQIADPSNLTMPKAGVTASELVRASQIAAHAAWTAAESANVTGHAAALTEARINGTAPNFAAGLSLTEIHDGALRAALPALHTRFAGAHVYGDVPGHRYLSAPNLDGVQPVRETLPGASTKNPGKNPGYPDLVVHVAGWSYVYEIKSASSKYGKTFTTMKQIARYVLKLKRALRPNNSPVYYGPEFPTTVAVDQETGILYRLFGDPQFPGVIFYAVE